jgi:aerobic-type carbon monoxide dehydrogenase small subunit (CoxS/CutS family)
VSDVPIRCTVNGVSVVATVPARLSLADFLRDQLGLTGTRLGCEHGVCGACTIVYDGRAARSCLLLAVQADGIEIETIEGAAVSGRIKALQDAFYVRGALQCGFCTAGILLTIAEAIRDNPVMDRAAIRDALSGNYCRCTGYHAIVDAVAAVVGGDLDAS